MQRTSAPAPTRAANGWGAVRCVCPRRLAVVTLAAKPSPKLAGQSDGFTYLPLQLPPPLDARVKTAVFAKSSAKKEDCPGATPRGSGAAAEFALIGRSNVGKSSLINALTGKDLAKVSKEPGQYLAWVVLAHVQCCAVRLPGTIAASVTPSTVTSTPPLQPQAPSMHLVHVQERSAMPARTPHPPPQQPATATPTNTKPNNQTHAMIPCPSAPSPVSLTQPPCTAGLTKLINHFLINDDWYLVDLPGYG